jgi:O-antigen ligase
VNAEPLQLLGMLGACGGAATALVARDERLRHVAMVVALVVAPALVIGDVWNDSRVADLRHHPGELAALLAVGGAAVAIGAAVFVREPWAFPVLAFATLALRVPVRVAGETSNLLVPLYLVIAAALVASAWRLRAVARDEDGSPRRPPAEPQLARWLSWLLAATLVLYALQSAYSEDVSNAIEDACFFLVPFAVLFALLLDVEWNRRLLTWLLATVAGIGLVLAAIALWEYAVRDLILNQQLLESNQIHLYFRVNSLFHDPNVFGRYLALTIVALGAFVVWTPRRELAIAGAACAGVLLVALALSFSVTSFLATIAGLLVVALFRFGLGRAAIAAAGAVVFFALFFALGGAERSHMGPQRGLDAETSGRVDLVSGGLELAGDRPLWGWGSGAFGRAFTTRIERAETTTSHAEPITVAAEQGAIGIVFYVAVIGVSLALLMGAGAGGIPARATVAACYVALLVHTLGYAGFLIDPVTWALLALGVAFARPPGRSEPVPVPAEVRRELAGPGASPPPAPGRATAEQGPAPTPGA